MPSELVPDLLATLDTLSGGVHPGFRPVHARGVMVAGTFVRGPEAPSLTRAPHANRPSTPVTVRFSLSSGVGRVLAEWVVAGAPPFDLGRLAPARFAGQALPADDLRKAGVWQYANYYTPRSARPS